jgi:hypothetical protein
MLPELAGIIDRNSLVYVTGITTLNKEIYTDILRRIRDKVRRRSPEKWGTNSWFFIHDNASAHRSVLFMDFLAKKQRDNTSILLIWFQLIYACFLN